MNSGSIDTQDLRGFANRRQFPGGWFRRRLESRNVSIATQAADLIGGEAFAGGVFVPLTIENASDDIVGVMSSKAGKQGDDIFVGTNATRLGARQGEIQFCKSAASPAQSEMGVVLVPIDGSYHLFQERAQKLFAIAVCSGRCRPDFMQIGAERAQFVLFFLSERTRPSLFPAHEFCLGGREVA
jgi:hypothetical protein